MWLLEFPVTSQDDQAKAGQDDKRPGEGELNFLWTVAMVDVADRLIRLLKYIYTEAHKGRKVKSPSSSAKRNGRLRKRN